MECCGLPKNLRTIKQQEVPVTVQERLNYLWDASFLLIRSSACTSHRISKAFVSLAQEHKVDLPSQITDQLCGFCSVIIIPSVTCKIRLIPKKRNSKINRSVEKKLKNQLVTQCSMCGKTFKTPGFVRKKAIISINEKAPVSVASSNTLVGQTTASKENHAKQKPAFSFLAKRKL